MCPFRWLSPNCLHKEHLLGTQKSIAFPTKLPMYWTAASPGSLQKNCSTICNSGFISFSFSCWLMKGWRESCSVVSSSLQPYGPCNPWNSPGQNTGAGSLSLLQVSHSAGRFFSCWATRELRYNWWLSTLSGNIWYQLKQQGNTHNNRSSIKI